jgi:hypothetical protein
MILKVYFRPLALWTLFCIFLWGTSNSVTTANPYIMTGIDSAYIDIGGSGLVLYHTIRPAVGCGYNIKLDSFVLSPNFSLSKDINDGHGTLKKMFSLALLPISINFGVDFGYDFGKTILLFNFSNTFQRSELSILSKTLHSTYGPEIRFSIDKNLSVSAYLRIISLGVGKDARYHMDINVINEVLKALLEDTKYIATGIRLIYNF